MLQLEDQMGLLDPNMVILCLFDIYRGIFAHEEMRVQSSAVASEIQASAKLSLLWYLLQKVTSSANPPEDTSLKVFLGDLVVGIHGEFIRSENSSG